MILSAGLHDASAYHQAIVAAAQRHDMRIVGPDCLAIMAPHALINATFARTSVLPGNLGPNSQSGALNTAVLDWAQSRQVGFSGIISAGDMTDAKLGDLIDVLATDPHTHAILLNADCLTEAAEFMVAARAAVLHKPIIAINAGKSQLAARATLSHTWQRSLKDYHLDDRAAMEANLLVDSRTSSLRFHR
ncbi:hypothetical protein PX699_28835 [Sphingobium sp. H39-3-25]|uniref:hypothetical protein n=1 Tax=Sphingobium arseniciresistens TaxID=3030834 RepID=UPI0023BA206D|nr:hypothetical protein [Sphingobium arseniciresistens]